MRYQSDLHDLPCGPCDLRSPFSRLACRESWLQLESTKVPISRRFVGRACSDSRCSPEHACGWRCDPSELMLCCGCVVGVQFCRHADFQVAESVRASERDLNISPLTTDISSSCRTVKARSLETHRRGLTWPVTEGLNTPPLASLRQLSISFTSG